MDPWLEARESKFRSIAKALTYRITGTVTTMIVTFAVTGELAVAMAVGSVEPIVKITVYYLHERAWQRVPIGTMRRMAHFFALPFSRFRRQKSSVL